MGRNVSIGIYPSNLKTLLGKTADRPTSTNAGVQFFNTDTNQLEIYNGEGWHAINDVLPVTVSNSGTVQANRSYWVDTSGGALTLTLPSSPNQYDYIKFTDISGTFDSNNLTVNPNGQRIMRTADNMTVSTEGASITMIYYGSGQGWLLEAI